LGGWKRKISLHLFGECGTSVPYSTLRRLPLSACRFHLYLPPQPPRFHLRLPPASRLRRIRPPPSSASAAFSPPSEGNRGAPPPHRFPIGRPPCGNERMVGEVKKGGGYSHSAGSTSAGLRSAGRSPPHSVAPGRQGISRDPCGSRPRIGSCMRRSTARIRPPCALRGALVSRSASRRIRRRRQGVHEKGLTGASPLSDFSRILPVSVEEPAERWARRLGGAPRRRICFLRPTRREGAGPDGEFEQPDVPHVPKRLDSASDGIESI